MKPAAAPYCPTHEMLKQRMRADLRVYRDAVDVLEESALGATPKGFEKAHKLAEIGRISYEAARDRFNAHVASHRCEVRHLRYGTRQRA